MRASDYIFKRLKEKYGVDRVFMITGGGAMHLNDAVLQSGLAYTCCHHEQACAIAAEGYVRAGKPLGVVNVTTGPGGLNTLTGVMGQWTDSVPVLYISGQVKQSTTIAACNMPGRYGMSRKWGGFWTRPSMRLCRVVPGRSGSMCRWIYRELRFGNLTLKGSMKVP